MDGIYIYCVRVYVCVCAHALWSTHQQLLWQPVGWASSRIDIPVQPPRQQAGGPRWALMVKLQVQPPRGGLSPPIYFAFTASCKQPGALSLAAGGEGWELGLARCQHGDTNGNSACNPLAKSIRGKHESFLQSKSCLSSWHTENMASLVRMTNLWPPQGVEMGAAEAPLGPLMLLMKQESPGV